VNVARRAGQLLVRALAGDEGDLVVDDRAVAACRERADEGDDDARAQLRLFVQQRTLLARVHSAIADDVVIVTFADGSSLRRGDAEKALVAKEERRVFLPVRGPLFAARQQVRDPALQRFAFDVVEAEVVGVVGATRRERRRQQLRTFLAASADAVPAVLDALGRTGHAEVDSAPALERALDLPVPHLVNDGVLVDLVRATREAIPDAQAARLQRRNAPRALAGQIVVDEAARLLVAPTLRSGLHRAQLLGVGRLYGVLAGCPDIGDALSLSLSSPPVRRVLDVTVKDAEFLWRHTLCASFLEARVQAAVALAVVDNVADPEAAARDAFFQRRDEARAGARKAVGLDVGSAIVDELLAPPWPDGLALDAVDDHHLDRAWRAADAARALAWLRDTLDDGALLRRKGLQALPELWRPAEAHDDDGRVAATAWGELVDTVL